MADGYLNFDTKINTDGFNKGISAIGKMVSGAGNMVSSLGKAFTPVSAAVAGVGVAAAKTAIDFTKLYESTMVVFEKMLGGKQAANDLYGSLLSIAKASTFSQEAFLTAGKKLVGMGIDAQDTTRYMQAITDAVAGFGGTSENLTNVAENFAKISTAGKLSMEDVNMLSDNGIQALKILGNQYGVTTDEMRDMISKGSVPAKDAMDKLAEGIENGTDGANGMTAAMAGMSLAMKGKTLTGALDSLNSGFRGFALNLVGINPTLKETDAGYEESTKRLQQLTSAISTVAGIMPSVAKVFSGFTDGIGKLLDKLVGANVAFNEATGTWQNVEGILGKLKEKLDTLEPEKLKKIGDAILAMAGAGIALPVLGSGISKVGGVIKGLDKVIAPAENAITGLPSVVSSTAGKVKKAAKSFGNLKDAVLLPLSDLLPGMEGLGSKLSGVTKNVVGKIVSPFGKLGGKIAAKFPGAIGKLTGFTDYLGSWGGIVGDSMKGVVSSVASFAPGFIKMLKFGAIAGALVAGLGLLQGQFGEQITGFLQIVAEKGPLIISNLCNGITAKLPEVISQGAVLIQNLLQAITANLPAIITGGIQIIAGLISGIAQQLPSLIPVALQMILTVVMSLLQNIPQLINAGLQLIMGLAQGLINAIPMLISAIPTLIQTLVTGIVQNLPTIIMVGIQLLIALITGIVQAIPQLIGMIPQIFQAFADGVMSVDWLSVGKQILSSIVDGIKSIGSSLWDAVKGIFDDGDEEAQEKGKSTGEKYAQGVQSTTANAQLSASNLALATTNSFTTSLDTQGAIVSEAATNMGNSANTGLQLANVPSAFSANAQAAASSMKGAFDANDISAASAAQLMGESANNGITSANMGGTFSATGVQAGQNLGAALNGQTGAVSGAAANVAGAAQTSVSNVNLGGAYAKEGTQAMQSLAASLNSSTSAVNTAGKGIGNAALTGLKSAQMPVKAKTEGTNFIKSLCDSIKAGTNLVRAAVNVVMLAAKTTASSNGLSSAGYTAGYQFSTGLANGIAAGRHGVANAAAQVANAAVEAAKSNLDINSPSKVGFWIGKMFDTGIANGIAGSIAKVASGVHRMTDVLEEGTQSALKSLQNKAVMSTAASASGLYTSATSKIYGQSTDYMGLLDEWERRQKKLDGQRDSRPVILDGRRIDRAKKNRGGVQV